MLDFLLQYYFHVEKEILVFLGTKTQKDSIFAAIQAKDLWKKETFRKKFKSFVTSKWIPNEIILQEKAKQVFMRSIFGTKSDYADKLFDLMSWHNSRDWNFDSMNELDQNKSKGIEGMTALTRLRYKETSKFLHLNLFENEPMMCLLAHPMVVKIPLRSFQYFLDIHSSFAFNSIRKANHPKATELISYLYEILFLQQKIAISIHEYARLTIIVDREKKKNLFITAEVNAILGADIVFFYLKASLEKIIALIGLIYGIDNLDSKKNHHAKIKSLSQLIPEEIHKQFYCQFVLEFVKSESIESLNNYRSGLLHKKGISDLQPHSYVGEKPEAIPLRKIFKVLHEEHVRNTTVLIGALAMLTDELCRLDPPNIKFEEIPR